MLQQPIRVLIPGESREIYEKIYLAYWAEYKPETPSEADAVEDIINSRWEIRRFEAIESNYFSMAGTLYQDNQEYKDSAPDTQQRASFNHLIETQPGFEACARFIERNQKAHSRALRNLDRIRKAAGKPKIEVTANEVEKENPSNTPPRPQPTEMPKKDQNKVTNPEPPKREQGKATIEILGAIILFLSLTLYGHQKLKNEGSVPRVKITKEAKRDSTGPRLPARNSWFPKTKVQTPDLPQGDKAKPNRDEIAKPRSPKHRLLATGYWLLATSLLLQATGY